MQPDVRAFFHSDTNTICYVVSDPGTSRACVIDSVLDYDHAAARTHTAFADGVINFVKKNNLNVDFILETHVHADHLSAAPHIREILGGEIAIGSEIEVVRTEFRKLFNLPDTASASGVQFDRLLTDGEEFQFGNMPVKVMHTPGHTPACATYVIGDAAFVGDTLFMPDFGTARCDFPGGDARALYRSIQKTLSLPDETRLFMCHDYAPNGREYLWETTVAEQKQNNLHIKEGTSEDEFVKNRTERDAKLSMPKLIYPSVQTNINAGQLPEPEANGVSYLKIPLNVL